MGLGQVILICSIASLGSLVGAAIAYAIIYNHEKISKNVLNFIVALGGGFLFAAVALVLIPEGTKSLHPFWGVFWLLLGSISFMLLDMLIEKHGGKASQILANALDSLPESIGIGAVFAGKNWLLLILLFGLQNITEGFNGFNELRSGRVSTKKNFFLQFLATISGPIGGVIGFLFLKGHQELVSGLFMFSAGGILYLIFQNIAPLAHRERHWIPTLGTAVGFALSLAADALFEKL